LTPSTKTNAWAQTQTILIFNMKKLLFLLFMALLAPAFISVQASNRPTHLRVGLLSDFSNRSAITLNNAVIIYGGQNFLQSNSGSFQVRPYGGHQIALYDGNTRVRTMCSSTLIMDALGEPIRLDGRAYRGGAEFARLGHGITAVNIVSVEEYLFSVVPSEMPASWHPEALKAQAVAARTYAFSGSAHVGFDVCDRVCCQVYRGVEWEHENTTAAVLATAGLAIYFNGQLIDAVYFASSGGFTENSENVWQEPRPYLVSVSDPHEHEPVIWTRSFTLAEIGPNVTGVSIGSVLPSGRVESLIIHQTHGNRVLTREEIRTFFNPALSSRMFTLGDQAPPEMVFVFDGNQTIALPSQGLHIISAQGISVQQPQQVTTSGNDVVFTGRGFGHGVGMSQRGAEGMARRGYTFREILSHFYTGITIE